MAKKTNVGLIFLILLVGFFFISQQDQTCVDDDGVVTCGEDLSQAVSTKSSEGSCEDRRQEKDDDGFCVSDCNEWTFDIMVCADYHTKLEGAFHPYYNPIDIGKWFFQYEENCPSYNAVWEENLFRCEQGTKSMPNHPACIINEQCNTNEFCNTNTLLCEEGASGCGDGICEPGEICPQDCDDLIPNSCGDTDGGQNFEVKGVVVKVSSTGEGRGFFYDFCLDSNTLREYYCSGDTKLYVAHTCTTGCQNGRCLGTCNTGADTDCDGDVGDQELLSYAGLWLDNVIGDSELLQAASAWLGG